MTDNGQPRPSLEQLRRLNGFGALDDDRLESVRRRLRISVAPAGRMLVPLGATEDAVLYLLHGQVRLRAQDGAEKTICHTTPAARNPISRLRPSRHEVRANTFVEYLLIDNALLDQLAADDDDAPPATYDVQEHIALPVESIESQLLIRVYEDLGARQLQLSCIPDVSIRVGNAAAREEFNTAMADWLMLDPILALRVMRACNGDGDVVTTTLRDAVARLGTDATRALVVRSVLLEQRCDMPNELKRLYRRWWRRSVQVSALCREMANASARFDPDFAALAGLMQRLGEGVAICYARYAFDTIDDMHTLDRSITRAGREIGQAVMTMWRMPRELVVCSTEAGNWHRNGPTQADYTDLVLLAQLQAARDAGEPDLPDLRQIPAFHKLRLGREQLDPLITESARLAVSEAEALIEAA